VFTRNDLTLLRTFVEGERKALEWTTKDGRTFQILGLRGAEGCYERFFHADSHPTRRRVGEEEIVAALLAAAAPLELYRGEKGSGRKFATPDAALAAGKEWLGVTV
jgi:hypothetical protein